MNGPSGFQEVRSSTTDHQQIGCWTSNSIDSEQVSGTFSLLTISSLARQASAQSEKRFQKSFQVKRDLELQAPHNTTGFDDRFSVSVKYSSN